MNELEMEHRITAVEKLAKGNERRIGDLESDNKALLELSTSVAVMAEQMKTMSSKVDSMDTAVKRCTLCKSRGYLLQGKGSR